MDVAQRVEVIEKRMEDYTALFADIRHGLQRFEARVDARFAGVDTRLASVETRMTQFDERFTALEHKVDGRFTSLEQRLDSRFTQVDARLTALDQKVDTKVSALDQKIDQQIAGVRRDMTTHFRWTIGVMIASLGTILAGMGGMFAALVSR